MTVAETMLELLDSEEKWSRGALRQAGTNGTSRCLIGARLDATPETEWIQGELRAIQELRCDPVTFGLSRIIQEQFPEIRSAFPYSTQAGYLSGFNDWGSTKYEDIRLVLEKAIADGL